MGIYHLTTVTRACAYYRCELPAKIMEEKYGISSICSNAIYRDSTGTPKNYKEFPVFVFQIPHGLELLHIVKRLKSLNIQVVCEFDDDYKNLPTDNPQVVYDAQNPEHVRSREEICRLADLVTVSTPQLVNVFSPLNRNVAVVPNFIDFRDMPPKRVKKNKRFVLGWAGAARVHNDELIEDTLIHIAKTRDDVEIHIVGDYRLYDKLPCPEERKTLHPYVDIMDFPAILATFDLGLIPLAENTFNDGKSELRGLMYGSSETPFLASPAAPYRRFAEISGDPSFLVKDNKDWLPMIERAVNSKAWRLRMGQKAYKVANKFRIQDHIEDRMTLYTDHRPRRKVTL